MRKTLQGTKSYVRLSLDAVARCSREVRNHADRAGFSYVKPLPAGHAANAATRWRFLMSDRERDPKAGTKSKEQRQPVVGRDVPDESKEHHTEIAVEAGHHDGNKKDEKSR